MDNYGPAPGIGLEVSRLLRMGNPCEHQLGAGMRRGSLAPIMHMFRHTSVAVQAGCRNVQLLELWAQVPLANTHVLIRNTFF